MLESFYPACAAVRAMTVSVTNSDTPDSLSFVHPPARTLAELPYTLRHLVRLMATALHTYCTRNALDDESDLFFEIHINTMRYRMEVKADDVARALG